MGNYNNYGVERLFDKSINSIDLRRFTLTNKEDISNVFYYKDKRKTGYVYLFIYYLDIYISLGKITSEQYLNTNDPNVIKTTVESGREYIIHAWLNNQDVDLKNCRILSEYLI